MLPGCGSEHHLLNGHVHPYFGVAQVPEAILRILWAPVVNQGFHSLEALTPGGQQPGRGAPETSIKLLVTVCDANVTGVRATDRVTRGRSLDHDELTRHDPRQQQQAIARYGRFAEKRAGFIE